MDKYKYIWIITLMSIIIFFKNMIPMIYSRPEGIEFIILLIYLSFWLYALKKSNFNKNKVFLKFAACFWTIGVIAMLFAIPLELYEVFIPPFSAFTFLYSILFWGILWVSKPISIVMIPVTVAFLLISLKYYFSKN